MESVAERCAGELASGHPRRAVTLCAAVGVPAGPSDALADRADEQVTEHLIRLQDARPRDSLRRGVDGGGRRVLAKDLRGDRDITGQAAGPLRGVRPSPRRLPALLLHPASRPAGRRGWPVRAPTPAPTVPWSVTARPPPPAAPPARTAARSARLCADPRQSARSPTGSARP